MIRDRRDEDLDRLCEVLEALGRPVGMRPGQEPAQWLTELDAERSWVFDQAPVTVAPTRNVVGHVQIYVPAQDFSPDALTRTAGEPGARRAIGRLFVAQVPYAANITRYLLREAVKLVEGRGHVPVLDPRESAPLPAGLVERLGLTARQRPDEVRVAPPAP